MLENIMRLWIMSLAFLERDQIHQRHGDIQERLLHTGLLTYRASSTSERGFFFFLKLTKNPHNRVMQYMCLGDNTARVPNMLMLPAYISTYRSTVKSILYLCFVKRIKRQHFKVFMEHFLMHTA